MLLAIGGRLGEIPSDGYRLVRPGVPRPAARARASRPGRARRRLPARARASCPASRRSRRRRARWRRPAPSGATGLVEAARAEYERNLRDGARAARARCSSPAVMATLRERLGPDAILTNGAGNFSVWAHRFYEFHRYPAQLAPRSGSMGYGVPAAVAAKAVHPDRPVVCLAGDGDFLMTGQELATAVQEELAIVVLVVNNGMYGTIRMHQERRYPGPRRRHRPAQPRLRRARAGVRRARRAGRAHRGVRPPRSTRRSAAGALRCSSCASTRRRSRRARRSTRSGRPRVDDPPRAPRRGPAPADQPLHRRGRRGRHALHLGHRAGGRRRAPGGDDVVAQARQVFAIMGACSPRRARRRPTSSRSPSTCSTSTTARRSTRCARSSSARPAREHARRGQPPRRRGRAVEIEAVGASGLVNAAERSGLRGARAARRAVRAQRGASRSAPTRRWRGRAPACAGGWPACRCWSRT